MKPDPCRKDLPRRPKPEGDVSMIAPTSNGNGARDEGVDGGPVDRLVRRARIRANGKSAPLAPS